MTPVNQLVTPYGRQLDLAGLRPQAVALAPNGKLLVTAGKTSELIVVDPAEATVLQRVALPSEESAAPSAPVSEQVLHPDTEGQLSYTGLIFSPAGDRIYMSNVDGSIKVFSVSAEGAVAPERSWKLPPAGAPRRKAEIPSGLAASADGAKLYVCGNLSNQLLELDTKTGQVLRKFPVGVAPFDVAVVGHKAYVSNWGGRRPGDGDLTGPAGRGTRVRVDPGPAHRQRRLRHGDRTEIRPSANGDSHRPARRRPGHVRRPSAGRLLQFGQRQSQRDRLANRHRRRDAVGQAEPGRSAGGRAQRRRVRRHGPAAVRRQRLAKRDRRVQVRRRRARRIAAVGHDPRGLVSGGGAGR